MKLFINKYYLLREFNAYVDGHFFRITTFQKWNISNHLLLLMRCSQIPFSIIFCWQRVCHMLIWHLCWISNWNAWGNTLIKCICQSFNQIVRVWQLFEIFNGHFICLNIIVRIHSKVLFDNIFFSKVKTRLKNIIKWVSWIFKTNNNIIT